MAECTHQRSPTLRNSGSEGDEEEEEDSFTYCIRGKKQKPRELGASLFVRVPQVIPRSPAQAKVECQGRRSSATLIYVETWFPLSDSLVVVVVVLKDSPSVLKSCAVNRVGKKK